MKLGQRIKAARKSRKWTQVELAERIGGEYVNQSVISKWESGARIPNTAEAMRLEALLHPDVKVEHVAKEVEARRA